MGARRLAGVCVLLVGSVVRHSFQNAAGTAGSRYSSLLSSGISPFQRLVLAVSDPKLPRAAGCRKAGTAWSSLHPVFENETVIRTSRLSGATANDRATDFPRLGKAGRAASPP